MPSLYRSGFFARLLPSVALAAGFALSTGLHAASSTPLRIAFTGQALITHDLRDIAPAKSAEIASALAGHDVVFTDLETAIDSGKGAKTRNTQFFHATEPDVLDCLKAWNFNLLALSNNHAWDLGPEGILGTIEEVEKRGFVHAGTGKDLATASAPSYLTTPRGKVALVSMASGKGNGAEAAATASRAGLNEVQLDEKTGEADASHAARVFAAIKEAAKSADVVIVYQHDHYWEKDNRITPEWKKRFARACIDAGATVFASHGAPLLHGMELYGKGVIFYDLGGLVFHTITAPGYYLPEVWESSIVETEFTAGRLSAIKIRPVALNEMGEGTAPSPRFYETRGAPSLAKGDQARGILERLQKISAPYGTKLTIKGESATIEIPKK